jgi:hypothetical protein
MRLLAWFACSTLAFLGGCILVYDPGDFQIADGGNGGTGADGSNGGGGNGGGGNGGNGGGTGGGGNGGGGPACSPQDMIDGPPVNEAIDNQWTWIPVPEAKCRTGSSVGFGIRKRPNSTKLVIIFGGAGGCLNKISCDDSTTLSSYSSTNFDSWKTDSGNLGILDTSKTANPVWDWNAVYIPYCTGDGHAGDNTGNVPNGPQNQSFVGFANVGHYMARIVPTFPDLEKVLVTGLSAGGIGALYNYDRIARDFCPVPAILISDSGPLLSDSYLAPCLQQRWRTLWGLNNTLPKDCPEASSDPNGGGIVNLITCLGKKYDKGRLSIIAADKDSKNAEAFGLGLSNCKELDGTAPMPLSPAGYSAGIYQLRDLYMSQSPSWGSYFLNSTSHTFLGSPSFYNTTTSTGVSLTSWVTGMLGSGTILDVGP